LHIVVRVAKSRRLRCSLDEVKQYMLNLGKPSLDYCLGTVKKMWENNVQMHLGEDGTENVN
jgi:hypothetical protein